MRHRPSQVICAFLAAPLLLAAAAVPSLATAPESTATPGSEGVGDPVFPTYGNGGYRVGHYDIEVAYEPSTRELTGTTTIRARTTKALSRFNLDFVLHTDAVRVNGQPAEFSSYVTDQPAGGYGGGELVVTPDEPLAKGAPLTVEVSYSDIPADVVTGNEYAGWQTTPSGALVMGAPASAAWWYPSNDHPSDKASYDIAITVPEGKTALSNGELAGSRTVDGGTTWRWRQRDPMVSYASFAAIGDYEIETDRSDDGVPLLYGFADDPGEYGDKAKADILRTGERIDWHAEHWGAYPFDVSGGVLADIAVGLENQTRPVYGAFWWRDWPKPYPGWDIILHENAHQWFGNSVSLRSWADMWLNEGFATFTEFLWVEEHGGDSAAEILDQMYERYPADDPFWSTRIGSARTFAEWQSAANYIRGAMTLQALRTRIGDTHFFTLMRTWTATHENGHATTPEFTALAERISGQDLETFFQAWLYTPSKPDRTPDNGFPTS